MSITVIPLIGPVGDDHLWETSVYNRCSKGLGCPFCSNQRVSKTNNLLVNFPTIASEWHPTRNGVLTAHDVTSKSGKKVWWKCPHGDDHEWIVSIANRSNGHGCPFCSRNKVSTTNSLQTLHPEVAAEWHPTKNKDLLPSDFTAGSGKRVWWKCPKGKDHEWMAGIADRRLNGCPFCCGKKVSLTNNLKTKFPEVAAEWHPIKNKGAVPEDFYYGSRKKVWWQCPNGTDHEWRAQIADRSKGTRCPFCYGKKTSTSNNLEVVFPDISLEWHSSKNGTLKASDFRPHSNKKVWWQCPKDKTHEYQSIINNRTKGFGCPYCSGTGTSEPEVRILCELQHLFGNHAVKWRNRIDGVEVDVLLPNIALAIEFDGWYWHQTKLQADKKKNEKLYQSGVKVLRVRQEPLEQIQETDVIVPRSSLTKRELNQIVEGMVRIVPNSHSDDVDHYIAKVSFQNDKAFRRFVSFFPSPPPEHSFLASHPDLAAQWHYEKNDPLRPEYFTYGSGRKVWWRCPKDNEHAWQSTIANRVYGNGCPLCSKKRGNIKWTYEALAESAARYRTVKEWRTTEPSAYATASQQKLLPELTAHMHKRIVHGYWTEERILDSAKKFDQISKWAEVHHAAYSRAGQLGIRDKATAHMIPVGNKRKRCVYVIKIKGTNLAYVGLTGNIKRRFRDHLRTKRFTKLAVQHGASAITCDQISDYIMAEDAQRLEAQTCVDCLSDGLQLLNKAPTGSLGGIAIKWTEEAIAADAKRFKSFISWIKSKTGSYPAASALGIISKVSGHMTRQARPAHTWTKEEISYFAKQYRQVSQWTKGHSASYAAAIRLKLLDDPAVVGHFNKNEVLVRKWTKAKVSRDAKLYQTRSAWKRNSPSAYKAARLMGIFEIAVAHMVLKSRPLKWTKEAVLRDAKEYSSKPEWRRNSGGAYTAAKKKGWYKQATAHMSTLNPIGKWMSKSSVIADAQKYQTRSGWMKASSGAYEAAKKLKCFDEAVAHMKVQRKRWTIEDVINSVNGHETYSSWRKEDEGRYRAAVKFGVVARIRSQIEKNQQW